MGTDYSYFTEKAVQCRRMANTITTENDPMRLALLAMAKELDASAAACFAQENEAEDVGSIGDVVSLIPPNDPKT